LSGKPGAELYLASTPSPIGTISWLHSGDGIVPAVSLTGSDFGGGHERREDPILEEDIDRYFTGEPVDWGDFNPRKPSDISNLGKIVTEALSRRKV